MAAYETPEQAAEFLADIHLDILGTARAGYSPNHSIYNVNLDAPRYGKGLVTDYDDLKQGDGNPTITQIMVSVLADSRIPMAYHDIDDFADDMGYRKPSAAIRAWDNCKKSQDWVRDTLYLSYGESIQLSDLLEEHGAEIQAQVERIQEERKQQEAYEHPPVDQQLYGGQKFITIADAIKNLDLGDYGEDAVDYVNGSNYIDDALQEAADGMVDIYNYDLLHWLPDNYEWFEEADAQGLLEGCKGDIFKMTQAAQYECYSQNLYDHKADIIAATTLDYLKDQGVYAISENMADTLIEGVRDAADGVNRFGAYTDMAVETMGDSLTEALGDEDGELSADMADTLRDSGYAKPNPCMMSAEAVRQANKDGYDQAFRSAWHDLLTAHPEVGDDSLTHAAEESRDSSTQLAQDHGDDAPTHEDSRAEL